MKSESKSIFTAPRDSKRHLQLPESIVDNAQVVGDSGPIAASPINRETVLQAKPQIVSVSK